MGESRIIILFCILIFHATNCLSKTEHDHEDYVTKLIHSKTKQPVYSGRVDNVSEEFSIEGEKASYWKERIGYSLWYGMQTNKKPRIIILMLDPDDRKFGVMLVSC